MSLVAVELYKILIIMSLLLPLTTSTKHKQNCKTHMAQENYRDPLSD